MEAIVNIKSSVWGSVPKRLKVYEEYVEVISPRNRTSKRTVSQRVRWDHVAQVVVIQNFLFSTLVIETTGGHTLSVEGLRRGQAQAARDAMEARSMKATPSLESSTVTWL